MLLFPLVFQLPAAASPNGLLMLGSSHIAVSDLERQTAGALSAAPGWENTSGRRLNGPGYTLSTHYQAYLDGEPDYVIGFSEDWRVVTLQESSQVVGLPTDDPVWIEGRDAAIGLDALIEADGGETVLMLSWANLDGSDVHPDRYPDFTTMQDRVTEGYLSYQAALTTPERTVWIAPVGECFRWIQDNMGPDELGLLFAPDHSHPAFPGTSLAAAAIFATLTGRDPNEFDLGLDPKTTWPLVAVPAVILDDPFGPYPMPFAREWSGVDGEPVVIDFLSNVRPTVRLNQPASPSSVEVLDGRLFLYDGADLRTDSLGIVGELRMHPGARLAAALVEGDLTLDTGTFAGASVISGDLEVGADAVVTLAPGERVDASGDVTLHGQLVLEGVFPPGVHTLISGSSMALDADVVLPAGLEAEVVATATELDLKVPYSPEPGALGSVEPPVFSGDPVLDEAPDEEPAPGCGCTSGPSAWTWWGLLLLPGLRLRRR